MGINATRALTCKYNAQLSCGRVQTPTLAMVAKREEQIRSFVPPEHTMACGRPQRDSLLPGRMGSRGASRTFDRGKIQNLKKELDRARRR